MGKRKALGRGLDALLGGGPYHEGAERGAGGELLRIPIELIVRGKYQPRMAIDPQALEELTISIRAQGVVQPIVVRPTGEGGRYEIIAGERRWRAAQAAGLHEIPALVRAADDETTLAVSLIENIQRENLNPIEEATALRRLIDEFGMTHQSVADAVGRSRAGVTNLLRLLELNGDVVALLVGGELEMGHARALLGLSGERQSDAAKEVVRRRLSVRQTERLVRRLGAPVKPEPGRGPVRDPDIGRLEQELAARFGSPVRIKHRRAGGGSLTISYTSLDELDGILARIR
jgi:ParB family chromosome partitioning protein